MFFCRETVSNAAKVFILVLLIFTTDSLEAAAARPPLDDMKSTPGDHADKVSFPEDHGRVYVPPSGPNPCTDHIPKPDNGQCH
jgi:hypothetical protein